MALSFFGPGFFAALTGEPFNRTEWGWEMQFAGGSAFMPEPSAAMIVSAKGTSIVTGDGNGKRNGPASPDFEAERLDMVARQIRARGIRSARVLDVMQRVPRHLFVLPENIAAAYADEPLPIGEGQTISQPFMVAAMSEALSLEGHERVLEVGVGSGYQSAILGMLAREVIGIESQRALAASAGDRLARLGVTNVKVMQGDGSAGLSAGAPYDAILVAAAAPGIPPPLVDQLAEGGRLVIPVGTPEHQDLIRLVKNGARTIKESLYSCRFVPLLGEFGWGRNEREITSR